MSVVAADHGQTITRGQRALSSIRGFAWRRPEWWTLAISLAAWAALVLRPAQHALAGICTGDLRLGSSQQGAAALALTALEWTAGWILMTAAMMLPLIVEPVRRTAFSSLWRRRHRAIAGFLLGYVAIWALAGLFDLAVVAGMKRLNAAESLTTALIFVIAAAWELTPFKRRALSGCHRTMPLRPSGWAADLDCLSYGALHGRSCIASCWALMLAPLFASNHLTAMALVTAIGAAGRYWPRREPWIETLSLAGLAMGCTALALA
jgi:predicted metal-binding membrane protein